MKRSNVRALARKLGLRFAKRHKLSIRRERSDDNWIYYNRCVSEGAATVCGAVVRRHDR